MYHGRLIGLWNKSPVQANTFVIKLMQARNKISNGLKCIAEVSFHNTKQRKTCSFKTMTKT